MVMHQFRLYQSFADFNFNIFTKNSKSGMALRGQQLKETFKKKTKKKKRKLWHQETEGKRRKREKEETEANFGIWVEPRSSLHMPPA